MDVIERIRRGYRAVGLGAPRDVLAMFHQEQAEPPDWVVRYLSDARRPRASGEIAAMDLFGPLPARFELIGVELRAWDLHERRDRLIVWGTYRTRLRGTWEVLPVPFIHIWDFAGDQVESVLDYLSGIEVVRGEASRVRRRRSWPLRRGHAA